MSVTIGILGLQGDIAENISACRQALGGSGSVVRAETAREIAQLDGLVIPGGESTTIGQMSKAGGALGAAEDRIRSGMPALGICAGMVLLAKGARDRTVGETDQALLGLLDIQVERNSFGRQRQSFEALADMPALGIRGFRCVFIRAPAVLSAGPEVEVIARYRDKAVAVKQGCMLATAFHPELTPDASVHGHFADMVKAAS